MRTKKSLSSKQAAVLGLAVASALSAAPAYAQNVFFSQNANGQMHTYTFSNTPNPGTHMVTVIYNNDNNWSQAEVDATDSSGVMYVVQPSNWTTPNYPNSNTVPVFLQANTVTLDIGVVVGSLDLDGSLNILGGSSLEVAGSGVTDNGTITLNSNLANAGTYLTFDGGTLSGSGTLTLNDGSSTAQLNGTLTQAAGHTIAGQGYIGAALTNSGMVNANVSGGTLYLLSTNITNSATFQATSGGTLSIYGSSVTQGVNGVINAGDGCTVSLFNSNIGGGTLTGAKGFFVATGTNALSNLTNYSAIDLPGGQVVNVMGNLVDNGYFLVNSDQANAGTYLNFNGGTLSGTGAILLNAQTSLAQLTGTLTQAAGHSIAGQGEITAALTNNGVVDAYTAGGTLYFLSTNVNNSATFEASNGGTLLVYGSNVTQSSGGTITASGNGNLLSFFNGTVTGGSVSATGGAGMSLSGGTFSGGTVTQGVGGTMDVVSGTNSIQGFTNGGTVNIQGGSIVGIVGPLVDNGTIIVNSDQIGAGTYLTFDGGTLSGSGTLTLNAGSSLAQLNGTLTQAAGHTIAGQGFIGAALTNSGTVNANVSGGTLYLLSTNMTNSATFKATSGGDLLLYGSNITQGANGIITAATGSNVGLLNSTITGGTLSSSGTGLFTVAGTNTLTSLTNNATIQIPGGQVINVMGNLVDNGTILVNSDQANAGTYITFNGGTLSGTGAILLNAQTSLAQLTGTLTQAAGHSIAGQGYINATLTNNGIVNANVNGGTLYLLSSNMTNSATFEASNGGTLLVYGSNVTQSSGGTITASGGSNLLSFLGFSVTGGTVSATGGAGMSLSGGTFSGGTVTQGVGGTMDVVSGTSSIQGFTNGGTVNIQGGSIVGIVGPLVDNGTITVNSDQVDAGTYLTFDGGTLSGSGTLTLNDGSSTAQLNGTLTQAAGHTIAGQGFIGAALTNSGTVNANVSGGTLYLLSTNITNSATFQATSGGDLSVYGSNITQGANGIITAATGSNVSLLNAGITGGTLSSSGTGLFTVAGTNTLTSLTNNATIQIPGGQVINVMGNLVDNGTILVNSDQANAGTSITFNGGNLTGTGTLTLNDGSSTAQLNGTLTQAAGHTIQGQGEIDAVLTNNGIVNANVNGQTLYLYSGNVTNAGTFEATNGGTLVSNSDLTDTGTVTVGVGSSLVINGLLHLNGSGTLNAIGLTTINYGSDADPAGQIRAYLTTGYNGDKWTGLGINSSIAATNPGLLAVGYADGSTDVGTPATVNQILIKTTLAGDANLDGIVNFPDLLLVAQDYGKTGQDWYHGDFNYDGIVNFPDLLLVAQNYGKQLTAGQLAELPDSFAGEWQLAQAEIRESSVPEPGTVGLLVVGGVLLARRRNRPIAAV